MGRIRPDSPLRQLEVEVGEQRKRTIMAALFKSEGKIQRAATLLGYSRRTLARDLRRWGIDKTRWQEFDPRLQPQASPERSDAMQPDPALNPLEAWKAMVSGASLSFGELEQIRNLAMLELAKAGFCVQLKGAIDDGMPAIMVIVDEEEEAAGLPAEILHFPVVASVRRSGKYLGFADRLNSTLAWWKSTLDDLERARNQVGGHALTPTEAPSAEEASKTGACLSDPVGMIVGPNTGEG